MVPQLVAERCVGPFNEYQDVEVSPNKLWWLSNKDAKVSVIESGGNGAASITDYLTRLERAMKQETSNFTAERAYLTATETVTKTIEVKSKLSTVKDALIGGLNNIIKLYQTVDGGVDTNIYIVSITSDVQIALDGPLMTMIKDVYDTGAMTREGLAETLKQFLPDGVKLLGVI